MEKQKRIAAQVDSLMLLAMSNRAALHITISFVPHVNWIKCDVITSTHNYKGDHADGSYLLLNEYVRLGEDDAVEQLLALEDKIIELLGDANA